MQQLKEFTVRFADNSRLEGAAGNLDEVVGIIEDVLDRSNETPDAVRDVEFDGADFSVRVLARLAS